MHCTTDGKTRQLAGNSEPGKDIVKRYADARLMVNQAERIMKINGRERIAERMHYCGRVITTGRCTACGQVHSVRVDRMCGHRLCPLCAMRRSRVIAAQSLAALEWVQQNEERPYTMHMVTLTQQNVKQGALSGEIDVLLLALERLRKIRMVQRGVIGAARTIEVTCNVKERAGLIWHPHVHLITMLHGEPQLATKTWWVDSWYDLMGLKGRQSKKDLAKCTEVHALKDTGAVFEVSKYVTKFSDIMTGNNDEEAAPLVAELDGAVAGRKLQVWTGAWRNARRELKQQSVERMNVEQLDEIVNACPTCGGEIMNAVMNWTGMVYREVKQE